MLDNPLNMLEGSFVDYILQSITTDYYLLPCGSDLIVILIQPYYPNIIVNSNYGFFDNYFLAYQDVRNLSIRACQALGSVGIETYQKVLYPYKELLYQTGSFFRLKNTLAAHEKYGTFFAVECFGIPQANDSSVPFSLSRCGLYSKCNGCDICAKACPNKCIASSFTYERCIRYIQHVGYCDREDLLSNVRNKVLGCNICQLACPLNSEIKPNNNIGTNHELYRFEVLIRAGLDGKKGISKYEYILGKNYLRPQKFLANVINAVANTGNAAFSEYIIPQKTSSDWRVRAAAERYERKTYKNGGI